VAERELEILMNYRDWQYHQHLLHKHGSAKFAKPTPRTARPADESFGDKYPLIALVIVINVACVLAVIGVLAFT
jgi:hypothetical protein